jgi:hypothetical protein
MNVVTDIEPRWYRPAVARLKELLALEPGWDGHGGASLRPDVARYCVQLMGRVLNSDTPPPQIVPLSHGGVQLEWHLRDVDLEIEIKSPSSVSFLFGDRVTGTEVEEDLSGELRSLDRYVARLR